MIIDFRIFDENGAISFNPASPFCVGVHAKVQQYRLMLYKTLKKVQAGSIAAKDLAPMIMKAMSDVNYYAKKEIKGFEGSTIDSVITAKDSIKVVLTLKIDGVKEGVSYEQ